MKGTKNVVDVYEGKETDEDVQEPTRTAGMPVSSLNNEERKPTSLNELKQFYQQVSWHVCSKNLDGYKKHVVKTQPAKRHLTKIPNKVKLVDPTSVS